MHTHVELEHGKPPSVRSAFTKLVSDNLSSHPQQDIDDMLIMGNKQQVPPKNKSSTWILYAAAS
jgi:hypothetical protein